MENLKNHNPAPFSSVYNFVNDRFETTPNFDEKDYNMNCSREKLAHKIIQLEFFLAIENRSFKDLQYKVLKKQEKITNLEWDIFSLKNDLAKLSI